MVYLAYGNAAAEEVQRHLRIVQVCEVVLQPENFFHSLSDRDRNVKDILGPNDWRAEKLEARLILANSFDCLWELGEVLVS